MQNPSSKSFIVFVTKYLKSKGIYKDEVIQIGENRFKSVKFRHTAYKTGDFNNKIESALLFQLQNGKCQLK